MAAVTYYRKKDSTIEQFFERLGRFIPIAWFDPEWGGMQWHNSAGGGISVHFRNDEDIPGIEMGPKGREIITRLVQGETSGWQEITVENYGYHDDTIQLYHYANELMVNVFDGVKASDIEFPVEDNDDEVDLENLPPEVLALDPDNPIRAYLLSIATPEELEEDKRYFAELERKWQKSLEPAPKKEKKRLQNSVHPKPKRRRMLRHR